MENEKYIHEVPPIKLGEVFVPEKEVREILKFKGEERKEKLAIFKEKLNFQKVGLARVQDIMIDEIRRKPEESKEKLYEMAVDLGAEFGMNDEQKKEMTEVLEKYENRHIIIEKLKKEYPKEENLFHKLFGKQPKGKIEIIFGPASLYIKCYDFEDYLSVCFNYGGSGKKRDYTEKERNEAQESGATNTYCESYPEIGWAVTAENTSKLKDPNYLYRDSQQKFDHEEQHAIKSLFEQEEVCVLNDTPWYPFREDFLFAETGKEKEKILEDFFRTLCRDAEDHAKDEILAYYKDGRLDIVGKELLTEEKDGGIYDWLSEQKNMDNLRIKLNDETRAIAKKVSNRVLLEEYRQVVNEGIEAVQKMEKNGYTKDEIIAILTYEPLMKWQKITRRIVEK